eukprot:254-Pelagococcus_subviridis.AAC.1
MIMIDRGEKARTPALRRKKDTERGDGAFAFCDSIQRITSHFNHATSESVGRPSLRPEVLEERPVFDQSSPSGPVRSARRKRRKPRGGGSFGASPFPVPPPPGRRLERI